MAKIEPRIHRKARIRKKVAGTEARPRLSVYKSLKHVYAQVIDDASGKTVAFASTLSKELKGKLDDADKTGQAKQVGALVASQCKAKKVEAVVFDRNGFPYHGRIAAVADGAREAGLKL